LGAFPPRFTTASSWRFRVSRTIRARPVCRKLTGSKNDWRIRVGDYRVIYEITDAIRVVRVNRVRHRREVYR
jgi:mRNA-degrading endonuclease RelE of RelBE toxin-antitoxin system